MKVNIKMRGEEDLSQRLVALAEMPGLDLVLDEAAEQARKTAQTTLVRAGHSDIARNLQTTNPKTGVRHLTTTHPAAWHVDNGASKTPALRWREAATRPIGAKLNSALCELLRRRTRGLAMRKR